MKARDLVHSLLLLALCGPVGCSTSGGDGDNDTGSSSLAEPSTGGSTGEAPPDTSTSDGVDTGAASDAAETSTTQPEPTTGEAVSTTELEPTTDGTTGTPPDPPGTGVDAYCVTLIECGDFPDLQTCRSAAYNYWGTCPARQVLLDAFGACMAQIPCDGDQDPCDAVGDALLASPPCP